LIGGIPWKDQKRNIKFHKPQIIVATVGRLLEAVQSKEAVELSELELLVIDEADKFRNESYRMKKKNPN